MIKDYEKLKEKYKEDYGEEKIKLGSLLKDKNIIIIQLESMQRFVTNKKINGKEITPNLNRFLKENIELTNMHMQSYSTTADSEHSVINSLYPVENGMAYSKYYKNKYDNLYKIFNNAGYYTSYMHGNIGKFWNRANVYKSMNINDLVFLDKFDDYEYVSSYLSDEALYLQAVDKLDNYKNPFISYIVAASSHTPFELWGLEDRNKISIDVGEYKDTNFGKYLEAVNYADYTFGLFINKLKEKGLYDNTAILIFGDHNGISMYEEEMLDFFDKAGIKMTDAEIQLNYTNVVSGLKLPGVKNKKITKPVSKLDIKPTISYLCGIEDGFSLGTNIFENKDFVCTNNERIITTDYYYDGEKWFYINSGEIIDFEKSNTDLLKLLDNYYQNMKTELNISNSIVINNLLK